MKLLPLVVVVLVGAALVYGTLDMPRFGDANAPIHQHVAPEYILQNVGDGDGTEGPRSDFGDAIPNMVTAILASYRGYDTMGELTVITTAGIGVLLLLRGRRRQDSEEITEEEEESA